MQKAAQKPRPRSNKLLSPSSTGILLWRRPAVQFPAVTLGLTLLTLVTFLQALRCKFINFDDDGFLTANPVVQQGFTWGGVVWAFTHAPMNLWHPLSFISLMIDFDFFGLEPAGYHAVNLMFHVGSVITLLWMLRRMTGSLWRSALATALFAVHPLRVESVVWVAERKDVLAVFFGLLAIAVYIGMHSRRTPKSTTLNATKRSRFSHAIAYGSIVLFLFLSLLAKPLFITLPALLLVLDFWPLNRIAGEPANPEVSDRAPVNQRRSIAINWRGASWLLIEKIPMLLVCLAIVLTIHWFAQKHPGRASDAVVQSVVQRDGNAAVSAVQYLIKMVRIDSLALLYPIRPVPTWEVIGAITLLASITGCAIAYRRTKPWLLAGWAWYAVTLLPVSGLAGQIGFQAMADRYTYFPCIGLLIAVVQSIPPSWTASSTNRRILIAVSTAVVLILCLFTRRQIGFWTDSVAVFSRTAAVTGDNDFAEFSLGEAYWLERKDADRSIEHFEKALRLRPDLASAHDNLGMVLMAQGRLDAALDHFQQATEYDPQSFEAQNNWGTALANKGDYQAAIEHFQSALKLEPAYEPAQANMKFVQGKLAAGNHRSPAVP